MQPRRRKPCPYQSGIYAAPPEHIKTKGALARAKLARAGRAIRLKGSFVVIDAILSLRQDVQDTRRIPMKLRATVLRCALLLSIVTLASYLVQARFRQPNDEYQARRT